MARERVEYEVVGRDVGGSKAFKDVGDAAETAGDKVDGAGTQADKAAKEYRGLAADIERTQAEMKRLAAEINKTGNFDLTKDLRRQQRELRKMLNINNLLDGDDGKTWTSHIIGVVDGGLQAAGKVVASHPYIAAGVAAGIALGAPLIGAAVSAAVGGAAIAGGILLASKDSRVQNAWGAVADSAKGQLTGAADVFVDPLINGARTFDRTLQRILPRVEDDFNRLAPVADRLFSGAAGFVENVMPGVDALSTMGAEVLGVVADELPRLGAAVSAMSKAIADGGAGGAAALRDFLTLLEYSIVTTGALIGTLEKLYVVDRAAFSVLAATFSNNQTAWDNAVMSVAELKYGTEAVTPVADKAVQAYQRFAGSLGAAGSAAITTDAQFSQLAEAAGKSVATMEDLAKGAWTGKIFNSLMGVDQAVLGFAESQTRLSDSIRQNGLELDIHTAKGQANREAILGAAQANMAQYQANIVAGMSAADATSAYEANTRALEDQMRNAGYTQEAIDGLIGKYRGVPGEVNTDIAMHGLTEAINDLSDLIRELNGMPTYKKITIDQVTIARRIDAGNPVGAGVRLSAEGGLQRGPGTGTSDDIITRVSNGEYIVRAAAVRAVGVDALDRLNQADRNPGALGAAVTGGGVSAGTRGVDHRELAQRIGEEVARALSRATLRIDDRTGRIIDLYSRAG